MVNGRKSCFPSKELTTCHAVFGLHLCCVLYWAWVSATYTENMKFQCHDYEPMIENKYLFVSVYAHWLSYFDAQCLTPHARNSRPF